MSNNPAPAPCVNMDRMVSIHEEGGQVFYPRDLEPFVALLALPGDDITPQDFVAF